MMRRSVLILILAFCWAGCKSTSFVGRKYDNFTAYYNTFYNAKDALKEGLKSIEREDQPVDRDRYLPLFTAQDRAATGQNFEDAVLKSADVLREHPNSKWVDDALMVIGKAWFYQQNYVGSEQYFREVITMGSPLEDEARFWLARTLMASKAYEDAANLLQESLNREGRSSRWEAMFRLALGELYVKQGDWEAAAAELEQGIDKVKDKDLAAQAQFLLGQVYETLENHQLAADAYERVERYKPVYELSYGAQYSAVRVAGMHGDAREALTKLRRMERDDKNYTYRAQLAYLRGRIFQAQGRAYDALDTYEALLYDPNPDPTANVSAIRGQLHYALGEVYRDLFLDYVYAAAHFDTASTVLRQPTGRVAGNLAGQETYAPEAITDAQEQAEQFNSFARVHGQIMDLDSLLYLGSLDEKAFEERVLELRQIKAQELEAQRRQQQQREIEQNFQQASTINRQPGAGKQIPGYNDAGLDNAATGFLFHKNPVQVQEGKISFVARWGNRPLVPNWRRLEAIPNASHDDEEAGEEEAGETLALDLSTELPVIDVSAVPRDSIRQAAMRRERAMARYELGNVLFLAIGKPDSAAAWYRLVIEEDAQHTVAQRAYYALAEVQRALGDSLSARRIYEQVVQDYPDSDFTGQVREHLGLQVTVEDKPDSLGLAESAYASAYEIWEQGFYPYAIREMVEVAGHYNDTRVAPRALLAAGSIYAAWALQDSLDLFAPIPLGVSDSMLVLSGLAVPASPEAQPGLVPGPPADTVSTEVGPAAVDTMKAPAKVVPGDSLQAAPPADSLAAPEAVADSLQQGRGNVIPERVRPEAVPDSISTEAARDSLAAAAPAQRAAAAPGTPTGVDSVAVDGRVGQPRYEPVYLRTLYETVIRRFPDTPDASFAQHQMTALDRRLAALQAEADSLAALADTARFAPDSLLVQSDSTLLRTDSLLVSSDSLLVSSDSLLVSSDSLAAAPDSPGAAVAGEDTGKVYEQVQRMPVLTGGRLDERIEYPEQARADRVEGTVMVEFVVDETGRVIEAEVLRGIGAGCDEEALRVLKAARFRPGEEDGSPVKVRMSMPITFSLDVRAEGTGEKEEAMPAVIMRTEEELGEVVEFAEKMPELIGGMSVLMARFRYPDEARQAGITGPVFLEFVVDKAGNVVNPKVTRPFGRGCDQEALRVIQLARYVPGEQQGERVNVKLSFPMPCAPGSR